MSMIRLKFKGEDGTEMPFEMPMNANLYEFEMKYCQQFGKSFESCKFFMDGDRIGKNQTPKELELVPDDVIDVSWTTPEEPAASPFIKIRVIGQEYGDDKNYRIRTTDKFKNLIKDYCRQRGIQQNSVRFLYDGNRISPESTPESLKMDENEDDEVDKDEMFIQVLMAQEGGSGKLNTPF